MPKIKIPIFGVVTNTLILLTLSLGVSIIKAPSNDQIYDQLKKDHPKLQIGHNVYVNNTPKIESNTNYKVMILKGSNIVHYKTFDIEKEASTYTLGLQECGWTNILVIKVTQKN